jgi:hypothetical protein
MPPSKNGPYQLMVEGQDDSIVIRHLLMRRGYDWDKTPESKPFVHPLGGIEKLLAALPLALRNRDTRRLGVIVDADLDMAARWQAIRRLVKEEGVKLPEEPVASGTIVDAQFPGAKLGIWLMPDNRSAGMLEHFVAKLIPGGDARWGYADEAATEARRRYGDAGCPAKDHPKSRLHTWLAWQRAPGLPLGTALNARILGHDSPDAQAFQGWFDELFPAS